MWPFTLVALFTDICCNVTFIPAPFNVEKQTLWKHVETGRSSRVAKGWKKFFFFLFLIPPSPGVPTVMSQCPQSLLEQLRRGMVGDLTGIAYSLGVFYTCCRDVQWDWEIGAGVGKAKSQPDPPFPLCLSFSQPG